MSQKITQSSIGIVIEQTAFIATALTSLFTLTCLIFAGLHENIFVVSHTMCVPKMRTEHSTYNESSDQLQQNSF